MKVKDITSTTTDIWNAIAVVSSWLFSKSEIKGRRLSIPVMGFFAFIKQGLGVVPQANKNRNVFS